MGQTNVAREGEDAAPALEGLLALQRRNFESLNEVFRLAVEGAQTIAGRRRDAIAETNRRYALLLWRGLDRPLVNGAMGPWLDLAQHALDAGFSHALSATELASRLQLESLVAFGRNASESLKLMENLPRQRPKRSQTDSKER